MTGGGTVTVADILELRAGGLTEEEMWALLCEGVQTLQDLFLSDERIAKEVCPLVTPDTLIMNSRGKVNLTLFSAAPRHQESYLAPEHGKRDSQNLTKLDLEKMWVYSLGKTLLFAVKAPAEGESAEVLKFMTAKEPALRASLMSLLNIILGHFKKNLPLKPFSHSIIQMYQEVFSSPSQCLSPLNTPQLSFKSRRIIPRDESTIGRGSHRVGSLELTLNDCPVKRHPVQRGPSRLYWVSTATKPECITCVGPEFVVRGMSPPKVVHVMDIRFFPKRGLTVILLTGQKIHVTCDFCTTTCGKLLKILVEIEELDDNFIFGLATVINGDFVFIPSDMKLHKVAPSGWKDAKQENNFCNFFLYLRVKFFLPSLRGLKSKKTKHLMYLQLRKSLLEQQIKCEVQELLMLGGLALQAEFGNFDEEKHGVSSYFLLEHYIPEDLIENRGSELENRLQEYHKSRAGLDPSLAEEIFVAHVQRLPEYGSHHYTGVWERKNVSIPMWVAVNLQGVYLYEKKKNVLDRRIHEAFAWKKVKRFSCNENYFRLEYQDIIERKITCYKLRMENKKSFFFFQLASLHHHFSLKLRMELGSLQSLSQEFGIESKKNKKTIFYLGKKTSRPEVWEMVNNKTTAPLEDFRKRENKENETPPGRAGVKMGISALTLPSSGRLSSSDASTNSLNAFVIDSSFKSSDEKFSYDLNESIPSKLISKWDEMSCAEERVLKKVRLTKDKYGSFGLEVIEGNNGGIFIESILKKKGEDEIGSVQKGDQVLSVNGICLLNLNYSEALNVLRTVGNQIEIIVSQSCRRETIQKPVEHEYLKNIRYETANEAEHFDTKPRWEILV